MKTRQGIYAIRCAATGSAYIGSSGFIDARFKNHVYHLNKGDHHNRHLQRAWNKYGKDAFIFDTLEIVEDVSSLESREQFWIDKWRETGITYNPGGAGRRGLLGVKFSLQHRQRISESMKGKNKIGRPHTEDEKRKISISNIGKHLVGYPLTIEARLKISEAALGHEVSQATRDKIRKTRHERGLP